MKKMLLAILLSVAASVVTAQTPCSETVRAEATTQAMTVEPSVTPTSEVPCTCMGEAAAEAEPEPSVYDDAIALWKLDEASGTRADSIGSLDLTDNNTVGSAAKGVGAPANLPDTVASFVAANNEYLSNTAIQALTDATVSMWVNFGDLSSRSIGELGTGSFAGTYMGAFGCAACGNKIRVAADGTPFQEVTVDSGVLAAGSWHLVVLQLDSSAKKVGVSLDGGAVSQSSALTNPSVSSGDIFVGKSGITGVMQGSISSVAVWSRLLTADEITALYNSGDGAPLP